MKSMNFPCLAGLCSLTVVLSGAAGQREPQLGDAPLAPKDVSHLPRRTEKSVTGGFTVNPASREAMRSFYNAVYLSSTGVPMDTTANVSTCTPGTNSIAFHQAVLRRINVLRAMAGVPADVTFLAANNIRDQQAAVMMSANNLLSHTPTNTWYCYTADGALAAENSNLALGFSGPEAITGYIWDAGANNIMVGHRRWILYPQTQLMGTGDVPDQGSFLEANATWILDGHYSDPRPVTREPFVAWPPPGYVPAPLVFPRWSFAYPNANFTNATVTMRSNGVPIAVAKSPVLPGAGENTLVWVPLGLNANTYSTLFPFNGADTVYSVAISNIVGAPKTWYAYDVTVFDPAVPGGDFIPLVLSGPDQPAIGANNVYSFAPVTNASSYQWRASSRTPYALSDGAEAGLGNFTVSASGGYAVQDSAVKAAGSYSFRLAHPMGDPFAPQMLTLNQVFVPKSNGTLTVKSRLGYAADGETAHIRVSTNGGALWQDVFAQSGVGNGTTAPVEDNFVVRSFPLGSFAGNPVQLRFDYTYAGSPLRYIYPQGTFPIGWYLDDLVITNAELWTSLGLSNTPTANFSFTPTQAGNYNLQARALIFTEFPLDWGPAKQVTAVVGPPSILLSRPVLTNNQVWINFTMQSGTAATFKLLQADQPAGVWTTNTSATLSTNVPGQFYRFTAAPSGTARFYRVKTP